MVVEKFLCGLTLLTGTTLSIPDEPVPKPVVGDIKLEQPSDVTNMDDGSSSPPKAPVAKKGE